MIDIFRIRMSEKSFIEYQKDYKELLKAKANKQQWKESMQKRKTFERNIYFKRYYESMNNQYDYIEFKHIINKYLSQYIVNDRNLQLFYCCSLYTGLIIETALNDELKAANVQTAQSFYLDNYCKADIQINGVNYQIKNITYLNYKDRLELYTEKGVKFLFYVLKGNNIYFIAEGNRIAHSGADVEQMKEYGIYNYITASELIKELAERGISNVN